MKHTTPKIGIIGFGSLMESLLPCCDSLLQGKREGHLFAVKGSDEGLAEKQLRYSFPITAGNPLEMLRQVTPQVILFSPPPSQAKKLTEAVLKPYYDDLRCSGIPYPLLICFPPKPLPRYYRQTLGTGISQVSLMPCVVQKAGTYTVGQYGCSLASMDGKALPSQKQLEQLLEFARPVGSVLDVSQDDLTAALSGMVTAHNIYELCFTLQKVFSLCGQEITLSKLASEMRFSLRQFGLELPAADAVGLPRCCQEELPDPFQQVTDLTVRAWYEGICQFAAGQKLGLKEYGKFLRATLDVLLMTVQEETEEHLIARSAGCATKGGLLERALEIYPQEVGGPLTKWVIEEASEEKRDLVYEEHTWPVELVHRAAKVAEAVFKRADSGLMQR